MAEKVHRAMKKERSNGKNHKADGESPSEVQRRPKAELTGKAYEKELARLQGELVKVQLWLKQSMAKIIVVFEGRDAAGKGGVIRRISERVSPRVFRVVALPAPSERERTQMYIQRYIEQFPAGGEIVLFDRS